MSVGRLQVCAWKSEQNRRNERSSGGARPFFDLQFYLCYLVY